MTYSSYFILFTLNVTITRFKSVTQHESPQNHLAVTTKHLVLEALLPPDGWQCNPGRNLCRHIQIVAIKPLLRIYLKTQTQGFPTNNNVHWASLLHATNLGAYQAFHSPNQKSANISRNRRNRCKLVWKRSKHDDLRTIWLYAFIHPLLTMKSDSSTYHYKPLIDITIRLHYGESSAGYDSRSWNQHFGDAPGYDEGFDQHWFQPWRKGKTTGPEPSLEDINIWVSTQQ